MNFEALHKPPGLPGREGFVERRNVMGVEIVFNQNDFLGGGEVYVRAVSIPECNKRA